MGKMKNRLLIAAVGIALLGAKTYRPVWPSARPRNSTGKPRMRNIYVWASFSFACLEYNFAKNYK